MAEFKHPVLLRWADLDPNFHLRHSVYYDFAATARMDFLISMGLELSLMERYHFGPILFREEAVFKREIRYGDELFIDVQVSKLRRDYARFSFRHELTRADGTICAIMHVDGAWIDTHLRKLTVPPEVAVKLMEQAPRSVDFEWV